VPEDALFHVLRTFAVDGVIWSLPDTAENGKEFGRASNANATAACPNVERVHTRESSNSQDPSTQ
jgi:hypothetical protein